MKMSLSAPETKPLASLFIDQFVAGGAALVLVLGLCCIAANAQPLAQADPRDADQIAVSMLAP
jgi:hypothetical protein